MSRPPLKEAGDPQFLVLRYFPLVVHLFRDTDSLVEGRDQAIHVSVPIDSPKSLLGLDQACYGPPHRHRSTSPAGDVSGDSLESTLDVLQGAALRGASRGPRFGALPGTRSVLSRPFRVDASGGVENVELLRMPGQVWAVAFSPRKNYVAIAGWTSADSLLQVFTWGSQGPRVLVREEKAKQNNANPYCAWSRDGRILAWCPGPWGGDTVPNDVYLFSDAGTRCVSAAHEDGVDGIAFSPDARHLVTASDDRTLAIRDAHTGEAVAPPWTRAQELRQLYFILMPHLWQ